MKKMTMKEKRDVTVVTKEGSSASGRKQERKEGQEKGRKKKGRKGS